MCLPCFTTQAELFSTAGLARLASRVFAEQFELTAQGQALLKNKQELGSERVQNPHDPDATYAAKGQGAQKKEHVGYKVQVRNGL